MIAYEPDVYVLPSHISGHPEISAMIGAFFSRSYRPMRERVEALGTNADEIRAKLRQYVVGYGHDSILDMANVTIAIENVPILAAVAIEDHPLFAGQETSTRYCDWSKERFINPVPMHVAPRLHAAFERHFKFLRTTYGAVLEGVYARIARANPTDEESDDAARTRAMRARAFDVARGFLPCGAITRVCWSGRLSSIKAHLRDLVIHPDSNIANVASVVWDELHQSYPDAVPAMIDRVTREEYGVSRWSYSSSVKTDSISLEARPNPIAPEKFPTRGNHEACREALMNRTWCEPIPHQAFSDFTLVRVRSDLDYGSLRDLHRHRRGVHQFPHPYFSRDKRVRISRWYGDMAEGAIDSGRFAIDLQNSLDAINDAREYGTYPTESLVFERMMAHAMPLATIVPFEYSMDVPQLAYLIERRTTMDVHPTLRIKMLDTYEAIKNNTNILDLIKLNPVRTEDPGRNGFVLTRGRQTITYTGTDVIFSKAV